MSEGEHVVNGVTRDEPIFQSCSIRLIEPAAVT